MRKLIMLLLLAVGSCYLAVAQTDTTIYLSIIDPTALTSVQQNTDGTVTPVFSNSNINSLVGNYTFTQFVQAFPQSKFEYIRQVYKVVANNTIFATQIVADFPSVAGHCEFIPPPVPIGYYPNDYGSSLHSCGSCPWYVWAWYLDYINAPTAWDVSLGGNHGDPSIVIGVTDTWFDTTHPDWAGKIARIGPAYGPYSADSEHGTTVAGRIACGTDNGHGYPAIGFNCRLDLSCDMSDSGMFVLSNTYGRKILNGSWMEWAQATFDLSPGVVEEGLYNEIYENGTSTVFAAGNGNGIGVPPWYYCYPASYDHVISVTNIMGEGCASSGGSMPSECDVHAYGTDTTATMQHNTRVDICAPGFRTGGLDFNIAYSTSDSSRYYSHDNNGGGGTSFAAPLVAGTLGLMLTANPCLSPYQLEYALKMAARSGIYDTPANAYLKTPHRLGAGALDAGAAVRKVSPVVPGYVHCNDPNTQTFWIEGVKFNNICLPYLSHDSARTKLTPILHNGTPPYTYSWVPIGGNTTLLDDETSPTPTIVFASSPYLAYWMLVVTDNSTVPKVANRVVKIQLSPMLDSSKIAMRDSYLDMLDQPNSQDIVDYHEWWTVEFSPDIWNRRMDDGIRSDDTLEYYSSAPNYMYVRIINYGCADYNASDSAKLHVYWTLASTGESWPVDWKTALVGGVPAGGEITSLSGISIPTLHPGDSFVTSVLWHPQNPTLYPGSPRSVDVCALARIVDPALPDSGFIFSGEVPHITTNVLNYNHVITKNMTEVDLGRASGRLIDPHRVYVGNTESTAQTFSLEMLGERDINPHFAGNLSEYMYVTVKLSDDLYAAWSSGGKLGNYAGLDQETHTITYDPSTPLRLDSITLDSGAKFYADLSFALRDSTVIIDDSISGMKMHFVQLLNNKMYGMVSYVINIASDVVSIGAGVGKHAPAQPVTGVAAIDNYIVYPNPAADMLNVSWLGTKATTMTVTIFDVTGRLMRKQENVEMQIGSPVQFNIANFDPGMYMVNIQDATGYKHTYKVTKIQ